MAAPETVYQEFDVKGDGNCFYRSLFNAARYNPDPTAFTRLLGCFGLSLEGLEAQIPGFKERLMAEKTERRQAIYAAAKSKYNKLVETATAKGIKSRAKEPVMPVVSPIDLDAEDIFTVAVRQVLVERIAGGVFEAMGEVQKAKVVSEAITPEAKAAQAAQPHSLPEIFHENAIMGGDFYTWGLRESSFQFQTAVRNAGGRAYFASLSKADAIAKFKEIFSSVIIQDGVFASQADIDIVKFILLGCGLHLEIPNPDNLDNPPTMPDKVMGMTTLFVRNVNRNHYHFFAPEGRVAAEAEEGGRRFSTRLNKESALAELQRQVEAATAAAAKAKAAEEAKAKANAEAKAKAKPLPKLSTRTAAPAPAAAPAPIAAPIRIAAKTKKVKTQNKSNAANKNTRRRVVPAKSYGAPAAASNSSNNEMKQIAEAIRRSMINKGPSAPAKPTPRITRNSNSNA